MPIQAAGRQAADSGLFNVVMHPQQPEPLPLGLRTVSWDAPSDLLSRLPPFPADKDPSCTGSGFLMAGGDYDDELPCNLINRVGDDLQYGMYLPLGSSGALDRAAVAYYRWNLRGFNGSQTMGFTWAEDNAPADWSTFWVGFGNLINDSWDWYQGPQDNVLTLESFGPYRAANGAVLMVIILLGQDLAVLEKMEAGVPEQRATGDVDELPDARPDYPLLGYGGALPPSVDFSAECAPVNDQLSWYACTAFAVGDGAYNFELGRTYGPLGWDLTRDRFRVSPKYLYIISGEKYGYPPGPLFARYTEKVIKTLYLDGIATEANAPYDGKYQKNWDAAAELDAEVLACDYWMAIPCNTWEGVETVKAVLARQRQVLPMRINLNDQFFSYSGAGVWNPTGLPASGHAMCIVGYDDARGEVGAFKVRNSWGDHWGDDGHVWIDYRAFINPLAQAGTWTLDEDYSTAVVDYFGLAPPDMPPPTGVQASDGEFTDYIEVTWDPHPSASELHVYRDEQTNLVATLSPDAVSWQDLEIEDNFGHIYWLQADGSARSSPDAGYLAALPRILSVEPTTGLEGATVKFAASGTGSGPMTYFWYFGGGADPVTSTEARPEAVLREPGVYEAWVTCSNSLGEDKYDFEVNVTGIEPHINYVAGRCGYSGDTIVLSAGMEGEAAQWTWQIPQGVTPAFATEAEPQFTLGAPGMYEGSLAVSSPWGADLLLFNLVVLDPAATAWQEPGFDQRNSGQSPITGPQSNNLKWKYYAGDRLADENGNHFGNPLVLDDNSLIVGCDGYPGGATLRRLNADGTLIWLQTAGGITGSFGQPLLGKYTGDIYVECSDTLLCLNAGEGEEEWRHLPSSSGYSLRPVTTTSNDLVYVIENGKTLLTLDAADGSAVGDSYQLADHSEGAGPAVCAPNGTLFIASQYGSDELLIGYDTSAGMPIGSLVVPLEISGMALSADGWTLFTSDITGKTRAYDTCTCRELWHQPLTGSGSSTTGLTNAPRVMADGTVITTNLAGLICALNPDTGGVLWGYDLPPVADCLSAPALGRDGTIYLGSSIRKLYAVRDDALLWQSADAGAQYFNGDPALAPDGTLYCGANDGWLYAFGAGNGAELVPPYVENVTPTMGVAGTEVTFNATVEGSEVLAYSWDFGGGAEPNTSNAPSPTVTLGSRSNYMCSLTVGNPYGIYEFSFWLQVSANPTDPGWNSYTLSEFLNATDVQVDAALIDGKPALAVFDSNSGEIHYLASALPAPVSAEQWIVEPIETTSVVNQGATLAEINGSAAVVYEVENSGLVYNRRIDAEWQRHTVHVSYQDVRNYSLAEINGFPAIAYLRQDGDYYDLRYARSTQLEPDSSGDWVKLRVAAADNCLIDYAVTLIDSSGYPNIAFGYPAAGNSRLCFARSTVIDPTGTWDWTWHVVDDHDDRGQVSDLLLVGDLPVIAYGGQGSPPALYYAAAASTTPGDGEDWAIHTVDQSSLLLMGGLCLIDGKPAIGYTAGLDEAYIHLAQSVVAEPDDASDWQVEQLLCQDEFQSLTTADGQPVFIVYSTENSLLAYWYYNASE